MKSLSRKPIMLGATMSVLMLLPDTVTGARNIAYQDSTVRFTVITDGVIRLEWHPDGKFVDNQSLLAVNRDYPVVDYKVSTSRSNVCVKTDKMKLTYKIGRGKFSSDNLSIVSNDPDMEFNWCPGDKQQGNLKGTTRTLDGLDGTRQTQTWCADMKIGEVRTLEDGLLATDGWTLIDDSQNYLFDSDTDWQWVTERDSVEAQDWYFMAYGHDYKSALKDFTVFAGKIPLPPRFAFGYWWSRYWAYSDKELRNLVDKFHQYDIPLDVLVIDMDWHYTDEGRGGWTGWTWNKSLFPKPASLISHLHNNNIKVTLNLHPADGFEHYEEVFPVLASALGKTGNEKVQWINSDKSTIKAVFDNVLHPMEKEGVDFWWLDWQQAINDPVKTGLNNTWWINYSFFSDMERVGQKRPMLYHRWGGLGNHRYQVGFSGDAVISWKSLDYQPYFTATASNVLYGYWSHDIGGHLTTGIGIEPEMYARWLQFGCYSPIMRTHSCKNSVLNKEPWIFDDEYRDVIRQTILRRYEMVPYIYTMARKAYEEGMSLCRPMYYDYPESAEAYSFDRQYMFGDNMLIAPLTSPGKEGYTDVKVWLPEGKWYEMYTGAVLDGNKVYDRRFAIDEYGVYVKAGSILPMYDSSVRHLDRNDESITLAVYPGREGHFNIYEDAGNDGRYDKEYALTPVTMTYKDGCHEIHIGERNGEYLDMPEKRRYKIKVNSMLPPESVFVDGREYEWTYDGNLFAVEVDLGMYECRHEKVVTIKYPDDNTSIEDGIIGKARRISKAIDRIKFNGCDTHNDDLASLGTIGERITYTPSEAREAILLFNDGYRRLPDILNGQGMDSLTSEKFLKWVDWKKE
ncbi:MAG: DUF5110 domain-containing protein [Duncaniella sp.]|nr:DUF5110 domain-containing protein [Duncaniella sp.]